MCSETLEQARLLHKWHKEAMSNGKCNKPWLLSPRMEGGWEKGGGEEAKNGANGERDRERHSGSDTAAATGGKRKKCQRDKT